MITISVPNVPWELMLTNDPFSRWKWWLRFEAASGAMFVQPLERLQYAIQVVSPRSIPVFEVPHGGFHYLLAGQTETCATAWDWVQAFIRDYDTEPVKPKCECGAVAAGTDMWGHSHYCPMNKGG